MFGVLFMRKIFHIFLALLALLLISRSNKYVQIAADVLLATRYIVTLAIL